MNSNIVRHAEIAEEQPQERFPPKPRYNLRQNRTRSYAHLHAQVDDKDILMPDAVHYMMAQLSIKQVLKKFKETGEEAVSKELLQIHLRDAFAPVD